MKEYRLLLIGHVNYAEPAFANTLQKFVASNDRADTLLGGSEIKCRANRGLLHYQDGGKEIADAICQLGMLVCVLVHRRVLSGAMPAQEVVGQLRKQIVVSLSRASGT